MFYICILGACDMSGDCVWTLAENMAGLEADIVIITSSQRLRGFSKTGFNNDIFLAITRCTYQLFVIDSHASNRFAHFKIGLTREGFVENTDPEVMPMMIQDNGKTLCVGSVLTEETKETNLNFETT